MKYFAKLDSNNVVINVIQCDDDATEASMDSLLGPTHKETWYDGSQRQRYAQMEGTYDPVKDVFIDHKVFPSWSLDSNNEWQAPDTKPTTAQSTYDYNGEDRLYKVDWDETRQKWQGLKQEDYEEGGSQTVYNWNSSSNTWEVV